MCRRLLFLLIPLSIAGCNVLSDVLDMLGVQAPGAAKETGSSELKRFESRTELTEYFSRQITSRNMQVSSFSDADTLDFMTEDSAGGARADDSAGAGAQPQAAPTGDAGVTAESNGSFSQTTIQEQGVDEADVVKTDGTHVYLIDGDMLRIVRVAPPEQLTLVSEVSLEGFGRQMYLVDGKVVALTETFGGFFGGGGVAIAQPRVILEEPLGVDPGIILEEPLGVDPEIMLEQPVAAEPGISGEEPLEAEPVIALDEPTGVVSPIAQELPGPTDVSDSDLVTVDAVIAEPDVDIDIDQGFRFARPQTIVTVVDVSTPESPLILSQTKIDGSSSSSRMIDGVLHLIVTNFQSFYHDVLPALGSPRLDVQSVDVDTLLPHFERTGVMGTVDRSPLLTWQELYRPTDPDGFGIVSVVSMDITNSDGSAMRAVGIVAEPGMIYSSRNALYLTDTNFDFSGNTRETTDIYKLAYAEGGAQPVATGTVPGRVLNQYSMGEHAGYLRVATTVGPTFFGFGQRSEPVNNVYVLEDSDGSLNTVGSITDIAPEETIQSARFIGDRGYVVTFKQIDPLFTLDLTDPTDPRVIGELKVPGFSTFIVPMDADHLLTVGQYIPEDGPFFGGGVQLSIFDVSDFANPTLSHNVVIGESGQAFSEALFNPKAFTYFADAGLVALPISIQDFRLFFDDFAIAEGEVEGGAGGETSGSAGSAGSAEPDAPPPPDVLVDPANGVSIEASDPFINSGFDGLIVYRVSVDEGFAELGRISTRFEEAGVFFGGSFTRGVFIEDDVFAVSSNGIRGASIDAIDAAPYELLLAPTVRIPDDLDTDGDGFADGDGGADLGGSVISGTVTSAVDDGALVRVTVTAFDEAGNAAADAITDRDGAYVLDVPPGTYRIVYAADGFLDSSQDNITAVKGETATAPDVTLFSAPIP